jgi:hypothetical protein
VNGMSHGLGGEEVEAPIPPRNSPNVGSEWSI